MNFEPIRFAPVDNRLPPDVQQANEEFSALNYAIEDDVQASHEKRQALKTKPGNIAKEATAWRGGIDTIRTRARELRCQLGDFWSNRVIPGYLKLYNEAANNQEPIESRIGKALIEAGFADLPHGGRGAAPRAAILNHPEYLKNIALVNDYGALMEASRKMIQENEAAIERIDAQMERSREKLLSV